jgi:TetR/AcrR family transcriptional repressor of nem operon
MRHPLITKERILKHSGRLFNTKGYKATSLSDITLSTGLTKGAIYRHFKSKEVLETETFLHLSKIMLTHVKDRVRAQTTAPDKLRAVFRYFESYISRPPVRGGCPLQNMAIESDDTDQTLRKKAVAIMNVLRDSLILILENGIRYGQLNPKMNKSYYASVIIASLEGAIMMSKLRKNNDDIKHHIRHLEKLITEIEL